MPGAYPRPPLGKRGCYEARMSEELASLDGVVAPSGETTIPVTDEGFLRGDGAFEVIRVYGGGPFALDEHFDRMESSAANLRLAGGVPRARPTSARPGAASRARGPRLRRLPAAGATPVGAAGC